MTVSIIVLPSVLMTAFSYPAFECPSLPHWNFRARDVCNKTDDYRCIWDSNKRKYVEQCGGSEFQMKGYRRIFAGGTTRSPCSQDKYQPFRYTTSGNYECVFKKSYCNEIGQVGHDNGTTISDRSCACDYYNGYVFMVPPKHRCYCKPDREDCTCGIKTCPDRHIIDPDYECRSITNWSLSFRCESIDVRNPVTEAPIVLELDNSKGQESTDSSNVVVMVVLVGILMSLATGISWIYLTTTIQKEFIEMKQLWDKERENFIRFSLLCIDIAPKSVQQYFCRHVPETDLSRHIEIFKEIIDPNNYHSWNCIKKRWNAMYSTQDIAHSSSLNINQLYRLIRKTIPGVITPKNSGYNQLEDDIESILKDIIKVTRDRKFRIADKDYVEKWNDLEKIIIRLSQNTLVDDVKRLSKQKLCIDKQYERLNNICLWENEIYPFSHEREKACQQSQENEQSLPRIPKTSSSKVEGDIATSIQENLNGGLEDWYKKDKVFLEGTKAYTAATDKIDSCQIVTLVGRPGSGKTATARHIALKYREKGWNIVPVVDFKEIRSFSDPKTKQIFVINDVVGIFALDMTLYHKINRHKEVLLTGLHYESKVICTCRKRVFNEVSNLKLFIMQNIVDLDCKDYALNASEKKKMLVCHCKDKVKKSLYENINFDDDILFMFPLLCSSFANNKIFQDRGYEFFKNPQECISKELDCMLELNPVQYSVLILCLLSNTPTKPTKLSSTMKEVIRNSCNKIGTEKELSDASSHLSGIYLKETDGKVFFIHDSLYEIVGKHYGKNNFNVLLQYMPSDFLWNKVLVNEQLHSNKLCTCIKVEDDQYKELAERMYKDIKDLDASQLYDVFRNESLNHKPFVKELMGVLRGKPFNEFKALFTEVEKVGKYRYPMEKKKIACDFTGYSKYQDYCQDLLLDLKRRAIGEDSYSSTYSIKLISWLVYFKQYHLTKEIINHLKSKGESEHFYLGEETEKVRILTLACLSGSKDMVELLLEYIDFDYVYKSLVQVSPDDGDWYHRAFTPLTAASTDCLEIIEHLFKSKVEINTYDHFKRTPINVASAAGRDDIVEFLINKGAQVNICDKDNRSPLYNAATKGHVKIVQKLIDRKADVNLCGPYNQSPLYTASEKGHTNVVEMLIAGKAELNLCDIDQISPLSVASMRNYWDIVKLLKDNGAKEE